MGLSKVVCSLKYFSCDFGGNFLLFLFCHKIILQLKCNKGGQRMWNIENGKFMTTTIRYVTKQSCVQRWKQHKQGWANIRHWQRVQSQKSMKATVFFMLGRMTSLWPTRLHYNKLGGERLISRVHCWNYKKSAGYIIMFIHTLHDSALKTIVS